VPKILGGGQDDGWKGLGDGGRAGRRQYYRRREAQIRRQQKSAQRAQRAAYWILAWVGVVGLLTIWAGYHWWTTR
jgi:type VI protein secretion system component VasF